ncbi:MAG: tetratricopeptide repeat protein [Armatimonadota bacterium]
MSQLAAAAETEGRFEAARDLYVKIVSQMPSPKALVKQSAMHLRLGETELAVRAMQRAMTLSPNDAEISYYLAMCHARNGDNLVAAVELERARRAGFPAARAEVAHRRIIKALFMPTGDLTSSQLDAAREALKLALDRYYGAASEAYQAVLELGEEPHAYYYVGAANWLLTVESDEDQLATAYLSLAEAARSAPGAHRFHRDAALLRDELLNKGSITSKTRVCTHLVREGQAENAQDFLFSALREARRLVPAAQREISSGLQSSRAFLQTCEPYTGVHSSVQALWQRAFSQMGQAAVRLDQALPDGRSINELTRGQLGNIVGISSEVVREVLLPVLRGLESEIEQSVHTSPRYHALLEQTIEWSGRMLQVSQSIAQCNSALVRGGGSAQHASADAFSRLRRDVATIYAAMETHNAELGHELSCLWRCLAFALQLDVRLRSLLTAEEPLRDARTLARALEFLQGAINIDPDLAISDESRQMFCDLLDDFQSCAQVAAGTGALTRVELLQNTMDAINSQVSPFGVAEATDDLLSEEKLKLFDWAVETLFRNAAPLPREFIIAAKADCYAATNYRFAHRIPDATNHQVLPLNQIDRYDVHVSGVTMRNVLVTLRDGRRLTFSGVRTGDVFPQERMSWLLGAHMWQNLAEVELEALSTGRAAPTYALAAQGLHDRRELPAGQATGQLPAATGTKTCEQCGRHNFIRDRFCRDCGSPLDTEPATLPRNTLTPRLLRSPDSEE